MTVGTAQIVCSYDLMHPHRRREALSQVTMIDELTPRCLAIVVRAS